MGDLTSEAADLSQQSLASQVEKYKQEIFSLRRNEAALKIVQEELSSELDGIHKANTEKLKALATKYENIIQQNSEILSNVRSEYDMQLSSLTKELKTLQEQLSRVSTRDESCEQQFSKDVIEIESTYNEKIASLNIQHESELNAAVTLCREIEHAKSQLAVECADLRQELQCVRQNYNCKKEEVEQLKEQLQESQEELASLQMQINSKRPDDHEEKGNSLFAEVNDRRLKLESIVRRDRATFLEMKRQHAESTKENRIISTKILTIESSLNDLMQKIGSEDLQLQRSYQSSLDDQRIRIRSLEKQIDQLRRDQTQAVTTHSLYRALEVARNDLQTAQVEIEDLYLEKRKLNETIKNSEKQAQRWQAEATSHSIDILKLKLQIAELQVQKRHDSFEANAKLSSPQKETISECSKLSLEKVSNNSCPIMKDTKPPKSPHGCLAMCDPAKGSGKVEHSLEQEIDSLHPIKEEKLGTDRLMEVVDNPEKEILNEKVLSDPSGFSSSKPHADAGTCKFPETEIEDKKIENILATKLSSEDMAEMDKKNICVTSILKVKSAFSIKEQNENAPPSKGVSFSCNTASPQNNLKLKKKAGVKVPVTFVKSDRSRAIIIKKDSSQN